MDRCCCCNRPMALVSRVGAFCLPCALEVLGDGQRAMRLPGAVADTFAAMCYDAGLLAWARCARGEAVPFDGERDGR